MDTLYPCVLHRSDEWNVKLHRGVYISAKRLIYTPLFTQFKSMMIRWQMSLTCVTIFSNFKFISSYFFIGWFPYTKSYFYSTCALSVEQFVHCFEWANTWWQWERALFVARLGHVTKICRHWLGGEYMLT